ncbi:MULTISPECIES: acyl-homoserine-lactone synthase [unclassified Thioalkalivibrio]|uniref:acyl-homoserine-lactone synthase n=1 Tax=unclassified Thioalkalivibrio TaxID=2621013 RepID=UPI00037A5399|nr:MULTISPECIES: GNAT family N-acyltransferase [unclassified Thioalkalivibrio]
MDSPGRIRTYLARSEAARRIHYRLRYEVYCRETGFEPAEQHPEGIERDAYDEHAEHFLISHEGRPPETRWVGAMRLILPGKRPLPTTTNCRLFPEVEADADVPAVEVSRLIVRGASPEVLYHLCQASQEYARRHGYLRMFFLVRPALARLLRCHGLPVEVCGSPHRHRGTRIPCLTHTDEAGEALKAWRQRLQLPALSEVPHYTAWESPGPECTPRHAEAPEPWGPPSDTAGLVAGGN